MSTYQCLALDALGDRTRRSIFELLANGPSSVVDIARQVPISRPAVSQHLKVLTAAGLVSARPSGTRRIYGIDRAGVAAARDYFDQFWTNSLAAYARAANATKEEA